MNQLSHHTAVVLFISRRGLGVCYFK